jgi:ABC-type Fe3+ transport system permease subunit
VSSRGNGHAWGSLLTGVAAVLTLPVAIFLTRYSDRFELLHSAFAIPVVALLGIVSIALARRARRRYELSLERRGGQGIARAGRVLGIAGVCIALAALVSLGVYGLLEYVGSRD